MTIFFGIRIVFALALFVLFATSVLMKPNITLALGGLALGYILPGHGAGAHGQAPHRTASACRSPTRSTCWSSASRPGSASTRRCSASAQELAFAYPELSDELRLVNLELRAGKARPEALRNLADRTGVDDLGSLVTMLIQTDKFGTSVAQSLRVYSETLRTKRRQRAEEAAAKTGVKMVFPLVFCIFPAIWVVTIGPAAIKFVTVLFPLVEGTQVGRFRVRVQRIQGCHCVALIARNVDTGSVVADLVAVADTRATRAVGLLNRTGSSPAKGLWIVPSRGVHTCWMRFAIDIVALDDNGVVIDQRGEPEALAHPVAAAGNGRRARAAGGHAEQDPAPRSATGSLSSRRWTPACEESIE